MNQASPRALVLAAGRSRGSLAAVRALSRAGWFVGVGTPTGDGMVTASRWCRRAHLVPRPRQDAAPFLAALRRALEEGRYDIVFGGGDDWMAALATYRDRIPALVPHPSDATVARGLDKVELTRLATQVGLAAPRTLAGTPTAVAGWEGPVVVKCRSHWYPGQEHLHRVEARRYADIADARERVEELRAAGFEPVLQEPVDGRLGALIGLFVDGRLRGRVQQETFGLWPTPTGVSSSARTVPIDEPLAEGVTALLEDLGWSGLVELQFLTDAAGVRHLIDLNGRFYGSMALTIAAGPNLADAWGRQALGQPLPALEDGRPGVRYVWLAGDLRRAVTERRGGLAADVWSTLRRAARATTSVWDRNDVGPILDIAAARLRRKVTEPGV